jgi:hypothetical protein
VNEVVLCPVLEHFPYAEAAVLGMTPAGQAIVRPLFLVAVVVLVMTYNSAP